MERISCFLPTDRVKAWPQPLRCRSLKITKKTEPFKWIINRLSEVDKISVKSFNRD